METESEDKKKIYCEKCKKTLSESAFYTHRSGEKIDLCKKCLTMHMNAFEPDTFVWALEKIDVPYIETEWNSLRDRIFSKDPTKATNHMSTFGKYLSKMKLGQWRTKSWADSEELTEKALKKQKEEKREKDINKALLTKFHNGEISQAQYLTLASSKDVYQEAMQMGPEIIGGLPADDDIKLPDPAENLTVDDRIYLVTKWGDSYSAQEWVELEKNYNDMMNSFDIQDADTVNTLKLLCKTTLKQNQALDCGDYQSYQQLSRVAETLRKTAKFTAAQNKEDKGEFMDSIGEFVALCEKEEGFIPRYSTDVPQDKIDLILKDMNKYLYKLVTQDLGFGQQIEDSLKKIQIQKEMQEAEEKDFLNMEADEITNDDYEDFINDIQEQKEEDIRNMKGV